MIEFPTDAKFTNMQLAPKNKDTLYLNNEALLTYISNNNAWEIPQKFIPKDYERFTGDLQSVTPTLNDNDPTSAGTYLNVGGVYRFTFTSDDDVSITGSISSDEIYANTKFINNNDGSEITKSLTNDKQTVITIAPRVKSNTVRSIFLNGKTINICSVAIVETSPSTAKVVGTHGSNISVSGDASLDGTIISKNNDSTVFIKDDTSGKQISQSFTFSS